MYFNRWVVFIACCFIQACSGLGYSFSIFSPTLQSLFHLDEVEIGTVASLGFNLGGYLAIFSGYIYDSLGRHNHLGPRVVLWIGALFSFLGYLGIHALAAGYLLYSFPALVLMALLAGNGGTWLDTASLTTCVHNYPGDRGTVVGILKAFIGLSGTIFSAIYMALFKPETVAFLLFLALFPSALALALSALINKVPDEYFERYAVSRRASLAGGDWEEEERGREEREGAAGAAAAAGSYKVAKISKDRRFAIVYALVGSVAVFGLGAALWSARHHMGGGGRREVLCVMILLLASLLLVPLGSGPLTYPRRQRWGWGQRVEENVPAAVSGGVPGRQGRGRGTLGEREAEREGGQMRDDLKEALLPPPPLPGSQRETGGQFRDREEQRQQQEPRLLLGPPLDPAIAEALALGPSEEDEEVEVERAPVRNLRPGQAARTLPFWLIVLQAAIGLGTGLTLINNLAGLVVSLGGEPGGQVVFVSLFSVANSAGRLFFGYTSERCMHGAWAVPRTTFLVAASALMTLFAMGMAFSTLEDLYRMALLGGLAFGGHWGLIPSILSDLFGLEFFASIYTLIQLAPASGGYLLATLLTGWMYEQAAGAHEGAGGGGGGENSTTALTAGRRDLTCIGRDCFGNTWMVLAVLNLVAMTGTWNLLRCTREVYNKGEA